MSAGRNRRFQIGFPALYLAFAIYAWIDFINTNHDGLANIGLFLLTAPVTIFGLILGAVTGKSNVLMPHGHGYTWDHALYYFPAVAVTALMWWLVGRALDRALGSQSPE
jgi:predicted signal transduction protein with EAL and GGDEF domain